MSQMSSCVVRKLLYVYAITCTYYYKGSRVDIIHYNKGSLNTTWCGLYWDSLKYQIIHYTVISLSYQIIHCTEISLSSTILRLLWATVLYGSPYFSCTWYDNEVLFSVYALPYHRNFPCYVDLQVLIMLTIACKNDKFLHLSLYHKLA